MSRRPGQHAKTTSGYDARHAKPVNANLAGSSAVNSGTADLAALKATRPHVVVHRHHHPAVRALAARSAYTVRFGDSLSQISARFCGTAADYPSLAAASGIANPNLIFPGQSITLNCHAAVPAPATVHVTSAHRHHHARHAGHHADRDHTRPAGRHSAPGRHARGSDPGRARGPGHVGTEGMGAFEACVISRESGGNPRAVNPSSGAGGLFQFLPSTWASLGYASAYPGGAQTAPVSVQEAAFAKLYAEAGTSPWAPYDGC